MYQAYQAQSDLMWPLRTLARYAAPVFQAPAFALAGGGQARQTAAACKVLELAEVTHKRPPWNIDSVRVKGDSVAVTEEVAARTPFATLLRFRKQGVGHQPKVLVVAPMSGHFATLLRDTVRTVLQDHDVYVTDWHNVGLSTRSCSTPPAAPPASCAATPTCAGCAAVKACRL